MQPLFVLAIDYKRVVAAPSHALQCGARFNNVHPPVHSLDINNGESLGTWFIDFHVLELLVQPTQGIRVRRGFISLGMVPQLRFLEVEGWIGGALGKAFFPFTSFRGKGGGGLARPSFPSPSAVA